MANAGNTVRPADAQSPTRPSGARSGALIESGARLLPLDPGFYLFGLLPPDAERGPAAASSASIVHISAAPGSAALAVTNLAGRDDPWLSGWQPSLVTAPPDGGTVLLTCYSAGPTEAESIDIEVRRLDRDGPNGIAPKQSPNSKSLLDLGSLVLGLNSSAVTGAGACVRLEAVAVLQGEGAVRFLDAGWIGRLGRGLPIQSFTLTPRSAAFPQIEYKALSAAGEETAWTASAAACGTAGGTVPLIGFSVRQCPGSDAPVFDCEYSGYFQSGALSGPARNGAPCLSPIPNDPLEGLRLRLTPRLPQISGIKTVSR